MTCITRWVSRAALAALAAALAAGPASASIPTLFHSPSDTGQDPGALVPPLAPNGTRTLYLYLNPGNVVSAGGCNPGTCGGGGLGDETCGLNFEIRADGDLDLTSFTSSFGQISSMLADENGDNRKDVLRVALVTTNPPMCAVSTRIGTLTLASGPVGGNVSLSKLQTVDASLDLQNGAPRNIGFVPEPGALLQLGVGATALAWLARMRARRGGMR